MSKPKITRLYIFCIIVIIFSPVTTFSQKKEKVKIGDNLSKTGGEFYKSNQLDSSIYYYNKAEHVYHEAESWEKYVSTLNNLSLLYYYNSNIDASSKLVFRAHKEALKLLPQGNKTRNFAIANLHTVYYSKGDYQKAVDLLNETIYQRKKQNISNLDLAIDYRNLGNAYKFLGDNKNAILSYTQSLRIKLNIVSSDVEVGRAYTDIASFYHFNNQIDSAFHYYKKTEIHLKSIPKEDPLIREKIQTLLSLAEVYALKDNFDQAKKYIAKAKSLPLNSFYEVQLNETLGSIYLHQKKYAEAITQFLQAQQIAEGKGARNTSPQKSKRFLKLAEAYSLSNQNQKALNTYQEILKILAPDSKIISEIENPNPNFLLNKTDALLALDGKAKTLSTIYKSNNQLEYLTATFDTYYTASKLIQNIRNEVVTIESKKTLSEKSVSIYEGAIQSAFHLYTSGKGDQYKLIGLELAESNKAQLLLEHFNDQTAKKTAAIPDSLLEQERELKLNIAYLEKKLLDKKADNPDLKNLKNKIFSLKEKSTRFTTNLEKNYPRYYNLKYKNASSSLSKIQGYLNHSNKAFLEYFVGENYIYLFTITEDQLNFQRIENPDSVRQNVETLRSILNNPPSENFNLEDYNRFTTTSNNLYNQLVKPSLDQLNVEIKEILIIPDYYLNYIPFDILLKNKKSGLGNLSPKVLEYLFEDFNLSYDYSITLHLKNQNRKQRTFENNFIGFAPAFKNVKEVASRTCSEDGLYALQCSEREVADIATLTGGTPILGNSANRASFESKVQGNRIIHLATHACIDEQNSNLNKIFLTDDYLSDFDLYNMELNADLAVLSACNTGSGKLIKGEGVMSLARGFINAGCSSTLISMWSVDDCATSNIMTYFYEGLKDGIAKDEALKKAKLKYLDTVDKSKMHPYYWAAFVPFGDMGAIELKQSFHWSLYLLFLIIPFLFYLFFKK